MLALTTSICGDLLLLFLLLFTTSSLGFLTYPQPLESKAQPIIDVIQSELKQRSTRTLLVLKRRQQLNCTLKAVHQLDIPTIRKDELTTFEMKDTFNSDVISVVCMTELADSMLLTVLAKDLHRMRESRIIIWLQMEQLNPKAFLDVIEDQASSNKFLTLLVMHTNSNSREPSAVYRLQPFPSPSFVRVSNNNRFPKTQHNFMGTTAVILADLVPPSSLLTTNPRSGQRKLCGYSDRIISEFANKYNITLKMKMSFEEVKNLQIEDIYRMTLNSELDLPIRIFANSPQHRSSPLEFVGSVRLESMFIVVPCGKEMCLSDVYTGLKTYSTIVLIAYFMFAILETLFVAAFYRIARRSYRFSFGNLLVNMSAFRGVFGLPIPLTRYRSSLSLQQMVMVMSLFSLIFSCLFNANLSTLLIKQPHYQQIENFEQLRKSQLPILLDERSYQYIKTVIDAEFFNTHATNIQIVPSRRREQLLYSLNTSYAYLIFFKMWKPLELYQQRNRIKLLCKSPGLTISDVPASGILMNNSVYKKALNRYVHWTHNVGLYQHWLSSAYQKMIETFPTAHLIGNQEQVPLKMDDLLWLWKLMGVCYAVAGVVFAVEILAARWPKYSKTRRVIIIRN